MSIPSRYRKFFPINKTGNIDNERAQINKLFRAILEDIDTVSPDIITAVLGEVQAQIDEGDTIASWGAILGDLEDQEDLWSYIQEFLEHTGNVEDPHSTLKFDAVAGEAIGGQRAVIIKDGEALYADKDTVADAPLYVGISTHAASSSDPLQIQFSGTITDEAWVWSNGPIYLGNNGNLTQTKPTTGVVLNLAVVVSPTTILLNKIANILRS